jgi:hypothetical protein
MKHNFTIILAFMLISYISLSQITSIKTVVTLTGSVLSDVTHKPISCEMEAYDESGKRVYKGKSNGLENGYYFITGLKPGSKYTINFIDMNYLRKKQVIEIPYSDKYVEFSRDFLVIPKLKGSELLMHIPPFEFSKTRLRYGIEDYLSTFKDLVSLNIKVSLDIVCYPDEDKDEVVNAALTKERCNTMRSFLISAGADPNKITIKPMSKTDPKFPPPQKKQAKGKRYIGSTYLVITGC